MNTADQLSVRLKAVYDMASSGVFDAGQRRFIDVGSDHGHLASYALLYGGFGKAVLTDIHEAPAKRSELTISMNGLSDKAQVKCTDGLDGISLMEGDVVVMAGLGGNNIIDIMTRAVKESTPDILKSITWCLQPQKSSDKLREFLYESGFQITDETVARDRDLYYVIMNAVFTGIKAKITLREKYYGPVLLKKVGTGNEVIDRYKEKLDKRYELASRGDSEIALMLKGEN